MPEPILRCAVRALLLASLAGCDSREATWTDDDISRIYAIVLESVQQRVAVDTLFADPRPRNLIEDDDGTLTLGDFDPYGDPALSAALAASAVTACQVDPDTGCRGRIEQSRFATVSEVMPIGSREAVVLASYLDRREERIDARGFVVQLRLRSGEWRTTHIAEGPTARMLPGF